MSLALEEHSRNTVRTWLGLRADQASFVPALPGELRDLLFRCEEWPGVPRDQWGCWEHGLSDNYHRGRLWWPEVDEWVADVRRRLPAEARPLPLWPAGKKFVVLLTHDLDRVSHQETLGQLVRRGRMPKSLAPLRALYALGTRRVRYSQAPDLDPMLGAACETERRYGVKASYFFPYHTVFDRQAHDCLPLPGDLCTFQGKRQQIRDVMRTLHEEGHDIGLHGSYRSAVDGELLKREREQLAAETGLPIATTRQHWLHWAPTTPRLQEAAGLLADSTLGYNRNIGFRCGTSLPFEPFDAELDRPVTVLQVPLVLQDGAVFNPSALELDPGTAERVCDEIMGRVEAVGGILTALFHPEGLLDPAPRGLFEHVIESGLERGAWFATLRDILAWWQTRSAGLTGPGIDGSGGLAALASVA